MSKPQFTEQAWNEYMYWHIQDKKTLKKINKLISDIMRNGVLVGEGKPELLKFILAGNIIVTNNFKVSRYFT